MFIGEGLIKHTKLFKASLLKCHFIYCFLALQWISICSWWKFGFQSQQIIMLNNINLTINQFNVLVTYGCVDLNVPSPRHALRPMKKTWRFRLPSSAAKTWCVAYVWKWCLRKPIQVSAVLASSQTAATATVLSAFASGEVLSNLKAKSSSESFKHLN